MQLLNKGCIIKAAHSTGRTIAVLGRGMDYSDNMRGGEQRGGGMGMRDLQRNQILTGKGEHEGE